MKEVATLGEASARRVYGDFSRPQLAGWKKKAGTLALVPHQQFANTTGKNSSDIALVIDAMDLLHAGRFDGFVLVSSDSDFTRLASRIREQGLRVYGIGQRQTPDAFRRACNHFIFVENLEGDEAGDGVEPGEAQTKSPETATREQPRETNSASRDAIATEAPLKQPPSKAVPLITAAMRKHEGDWVPLSVIGNHIRQAHSDFDPRTYGCAKLTDLLEKTGQFQVNRKTPASARMKRLK